MKQAIKYMAIGFFAGIAVGGFALYAGASFNEQINYQGKLTTSGGVAVTDGDYCMKFVIYDALTAGSALWTETWTVASSKVSVTSGLFSIMLGTHTSLSSVDLNNASRYLEVQFDPGCDATYEEVFAPRKQFGAVPAAFEAKQLGGATWAAPAAIGSGTPAAGAFTTLSASSTITTSNGSLLSSAAGVLTLGGIGGTYNENLIFDFESTENTVAIGTSTGVTGLNLGALNLTTTGTGTFGNLTIGSGAVGVDYTLTFDGETNDGVLMWMEDEDYFQTADNFYFNSHIGIGTAPISTSVVNMYYAGGLIKLFGTTTLGDMVAYFSDGATYDYVEILNGTEAIKANGAVTVTGTGTFGTITDSIASLSGGSLTGVKLGSLTSNGFVKTSGSDGTLSVDISSYLANPMDAAGQIIYGGASGAPTKLTAGSSGQILQSGGAGAPAWTTATYPATTTANQVLYSSATNTVGGSANLTFDGTSLQVAGAGASQILSSSGLILFGGTGNTYNENLTLDFETTSNIVALGTNTGVTGLDFGALNLTTTGTGTFGTLAVGTAFTFPTADGSIGQVLQTNGSGTVTWEDTASGMVYPGAGVAVSTGSAWDTSLATANLSSLAGLTYASASFVKMTGAGIFALDTASYLANPMDAAGQIIYGGASGAPTKLTAGSSGQILQSGGAGAPAWTTATYPATTTANQVLYSSATNTVGGSANLTFDGTTLTSSNGFATSSSDTGIQISGALGVLTMTGVGNTNNENLTFDFETVANSVGVDSTTGVTGIDFNALNFTTTGGGTFGYITLTPGSAPSGAKGQLYYNLGDDNLYLYNGGWVTITTSSSLRFKHDVESLANDWVKILQVQPKSFIYNGSPNNATNIGYIAEDFDALGLTDLVQYDSKGRPNGINYDKIPLYNTEIIKQQQLDINAIKQKLGMSITDIDISPAGTAGDGSVSGVSPSSLADSLANIGMTLVDGIAGLSEVVADKLTAKTVRLSDMELVDSATGDIYCTWIENGEWKKAKGDCAIILATDVEAEITPMFSPVPTAIPSDQITPGQIQDLQDQVQAAQASAEQASAAAKRAQQDAEKAKKTAEQASKQTQQLLDSEVAPEPEKNNIISVTSVSDISVEYGTDITSVGLSQTVSVTLSDSSTQDATIIWDGGTPAYDANAPGAYLFSGNLSLSESITNTNNLMASVNVMVAEQIIEEPPTENPIEATVNVIEEAASALIRGVWNFIRWIFGSTSKAVSSFPAIQKAGASLAQSLSFTKEWLSPSKIK